MSAVLGLDLPFTLHGLTLASMSECIIASPSSIETDTDRTNFAIWSFLVSFFFLSSQSGFFKCSCGLNGLRPSWTHLFSFFLDKKTLILIFFPLSIVANSWYCFVWFKERVRTRPKKNEWEWILIEERRREI